MCEADRIIFLDFPCLICLFRAWKRYFQNRGRTRADMGEGCPEKMDPEFMQWLLWKGRRAQKEKWLSSGLEKYLNKMIIFKSQKEIDRYLEGLSC